ncbi:MAG: peroxiredoxin [Pseudomonadota bacterium]
MKLIRILLLLSLSFALPAFAAVPANGTAAPEFKLQDQKGQWHTLADHKGKWVVLYFYPKDQTPGCTTQACTFRDHVFKLRDAGADVIGVSLDDVKSHAEFAEKYKLPFPLLADVDKQASKAYGVLNSIIGFQYAKRDTFLIDPKGIIAKHYAGVDPKANAAEVLADLEALKAKK